MMYRLSRLVLLICVAAAGTATSAPGVAVRAENFTVPPATGPVTHILARNTSSTERTVTIEPKFPAGWQWTPGNQEVTLAAGQVKRLPFTIERASDVKSNRYAVEITVIQGPDRTTHRQEVVCASAPYFK
ncbi:MAG: hypothetical protein ACYS14_12705, partial [Planctomycetota bacterium]